MTRKLAIQGGSPVRSTPYPSWPVHDEKEVQALAEVVRSGAWGGFPEPAKRANAFAELFAAYQGAAYGIAMANGTISMEVALRALGIGWRDEVIVPCVTFVATATAVISAGAVPVFVDVDHNTFTIDPAAISAAITGDTRAIMPVHLGQHMADMDAIMEIANRHSLAVIEDAAHAHGQRWKDIGAGCFGKFGSFSHQDSKTLTCGEGGSLLTNDEQLALLAHSIIDCGRPKADGEASGSTGANFRLTEFQAAILLSAMDRLPAQQAERAVNATIFENLAADVPGLTVTPRDHRITRSCFSRFQFTVGLDAFRGVQIANVKAALEAEGIPCWAAYPPINRCPIYAPARSRLPVAVEYASRLDPRRMHFPVGESMACERTLFLKEAVFRAGPRGVHDALEAIIKIQRYADELIE